MNLLRHLRNRAFIAVVAATIGFLLGSPGSPPSRHTVSAKPPVAATTASSNHDLPAQAVVHSAVSGAPRNLEGYQTRIAALLQRFARVTAVPICNYDSLTLDDRIASALELNQSQIKAVNEAMQAAFSQLAELEVKSAAVKTKPNGDQFFEIHPFDGTQVKAQLQAQLEQHLDTAAADFLVGVFSAAPEMGRFGAYRQEVFVDETNGAAMMGGRPISIGNIMSDTAGNVVGFNGTRTVSEAVYKARYGLLLSTLLAGPGTEQAFPTQ